MALSTENKKRVAVVYWSFVFFWALNAYMLIGTWYQEKKLLALEIDGRPYVADFVLNYMSAQMSMDSSKGHVKIYDPEEERRYIDAITAPVKQEAVFLAQYPPPFFLINTPLALLDAGGAWLAYSFLCFALILASLWAMCQSAGRCMASPLLAWLGSAAAVLGSFPAWMGFRLGQIVMFFFPAVMMTFWALEKKKHVLAGVITALLILKAQYLPVIGLIGLTVGGFRYFISAFLSVSLFVALSGMHLGWDNIIAYPKSLAAADSSQGVTGAAPEQMQNLRGLMVQFTGSDSHTVHIIYWVVFLILLCVIAYMWFVLFRRARNHPQAFRAYASLTVVLMLMFGPHTHMQDYILLSLPAIWLWQMPLPEDEKARNLKKVLILSMVPLGWILYFIKQIPIPQIPPFTIIGAVMAWYIISKILPVLKTADPA